MNTHNLIQRKNRRVILRKKEYETPVIEVIELEENDFIQTSGELKFNDLWDDGGGLF